MEDFFKILFIVFFVFAAPALFLFGVHTGFYLADYFYGTSFIIQRI